jgi:hypothetical protein
MRTVNFLLPTVAAATMNASGALAAPTVSELYAQESFARPPRKRCFARAATSRSTTTGSAMASASTSLTYPTAASASPTSAKAAAKQATSARRSA